MSVVLKDFRQTKVIELPSYPGSEVEIYDSLLVGDLPSLDSNEKNMIKLSIYALPKFIKSWNFTDEPTKNEAGEEVAGKVLEINVTNLGFLKEIDARFIFTSISQFNEEIKKKQNS